MDRFTLRIFVVCFFSLFTVRGQESTSEIFYRHHFYDNNDDYDHSDNTQYYYNANDSYNEANDPYWVETSDYQSTSSEIISPGYVYSSYEEISEPLSEDLTDAAISSENTTYTTTDNVIYISERIPDVIIDDVIYLPDNTTTDEMSHSSESTTNIKYDVSVDKTLIHTTDDIPHLTENVTSHLDNEIITNESEDTTSNDLYDELTYVITHSTKDVTHITEDMTQLHDDVAHLSDDIMLIPDQTTPSLDDSVPKESTQALDDEILTSENFTTYTMPQKVFNISLPQDDTTYSSTEMEQSLSDPNDMLMDTTSLSYDGMVHSSTPSQISSQIPFQSEYISTITSTLSSSSRSIIQTEKKQHEESLDYMESTDYAYLDDDLASIHSSQSEMPTTTSNTFEYVVDQNITQTDLQTSDQYSSQESISTVHDDFIPTSSDVDVYDLNINGDGYYTTNGFYSESTLINDAYTEMATEDVENTNGVVNSDILSTEEYNQEDYEHQSEERFEYSTETIPVGTTIKTTEHTGSGDTYSEYLQTEGGLTTEEQVKPTDDFAGMFTELDSEGWSVMQSSDYGANYSQRFMICKSGIFIPESYRCDGIEDCFEGDDESNCNGDKLICDDGKCIDSQDICDGKQDCKSGEDEDPTICHDYNQNQNISHDYMLLKRSNKTFKCDNGEIIPLEIAYDTVEDCEDGSDETERAREEKLSSCFQCGIDEICLDPTVICNGIIDCADANDEESCVDKVKSTVDDTKEYDGMNTIILSSLEAVKPHGVIILTCDMADQSLDSHLESVTWYKNGTPVDDLQDDRYQTDDSLLHISNINNDDLGVYSCIAQMKNGTKVKTSKKINFETVTSDYVEDHYEQTTPALVTNENTDYTHTEDVPVQYSYSSEDSKQMINEYDDFENKKTSAELDKEPLPTPPSYYDESTDDTKSIVIPVILSKDSTETVTDVSETPIDSITERYHSTDFSMEVLSDDADSTDESIHLTEQFNYVHGLDIEHDIEEGAQTDIFADQSTASMSTSEPDWYREFNEYIENNPPFFEKISSQLGKRIILRCPLLSMVPAESFDEIYWLHHNKKVPMDFNSVNKLGMSTMIADNESVGEWKCFIRFDKNSFLISYSDVSLDETTGEYVEGTEYEDFTIPYTIPVSVTNLPTEKELTEWITSTESDAFALFAYPPSASVRLGDSVAVSCVSENVPHGVAIYFIKTDPYGLATGQVKKAYQNGYANYTLIIHNVNSETAGHYQCIAMTNDRRAVKADFQINIEQPDIYLKHETASPPSTTAIEKIDEILPSTALSIRDSLFTIGFPAFVRCSGVKPDDYGRIIWYFNNKEITHRNDEYLNFGDTLFIRRMTTDTAGLYGCSVDHSITSYGRADGKVLFQHEGSPYEDEFNQFERVRVDRRAISHKYGDPLIIRCSSTEPSDYFRWYKIKDGHTTVASEESILYIQSFTEIGDTIFKCQVRSAFGEVAETSSYVRTEGEPIVTRHEPVHEPLKVWIEPHNVKPKLGDKILLDCRSNKPISYVHWRKLSDDDGSPGDALSYHQKLYLFMEEVSDYGSYKCSIDSADQDHSSVVTTLTMDNVVAPENVDDDNDEIELKRCANDEATCRDGSCIKRSKICDGIPDCPDATDEKGCGAAGQTEGECHPDQFLCASTKQCIQKIWLCDGENDCDDGNDELPAQCEHMAYSMSSKCKQSEFQCQHTNYTQCIPKSYICDESVDCLDQSDEVGCVKPTVIVPPEVEKQIKVGDTLTLRCLARGNPLPFINWRLNWGFVCGDGYDNGRCIMKQELDERNPDVVIGTLTVRNMQKGDAGAYSCEAINSKGFHFAIPDAFVVVKSSAAPSQCNEFGTMDKFNGVCRCKLNVISPTCSQCKHGYYDLSEKNDHGCRSCFCSGVSKDCDSDTSRFKSISVDLLNPEQPWQVIHENYPIHPWVSTQIIPDYSQASILVEHLNAGVPGNLYWQPSQMNIFPHGNLIKSYGGNMIIRLKKDGLEDLSLIDGPLVWLRGNKIDLVHHYKESYNIQDGIITVNLRIDENSFKRLDGTTPDRAHVMMALANVDKFWIWAGDSTRHNLPCKILSISIDIANPAGNGLLASSVERCKCPLGYTGTSCEQCANGYTRHDGVGLYLGECHSCFDHCNGKTDKCNRDSGQCYDCKDNTSGNRCQLCAQGFRRQHGTDKCERISEIQDKPAPIITINDELYDIARKFVVTIKPGERRVLKLHSEDVVPSPSSLWLRVESNGERVRLPNGIKQVGHNLIIENAAAQMLGTYEIKLQMTDGQFILVQVILQFDEEAHSRFQPFLEPQGIIRKLINEGVTINLNLNGFPVNRVIWTKDNQQIPSQVIQDYYQLVINRLSPELCGTYEATLMPMIAIEPKILKTTIECVSEERPYSVIQESVFNTPKISFSPPEVYLYEGQIMLVSYEILGEQPVELQWNRVVNGELYPMPSSFTILPDHVILNSSRPEDAGTYKVKASNRYGMDEATLIIHIRKFQETRYEDSGEPEVRFDSTVYELYPGQSIRIEPIIRSHTAYVTKWTDRNSNPLPIGIRKDGDALVIDSMSAQLTGSYVLEVLSANAKVRVPVDIEIKDEEVHQTQQVVERYAGQAANIEASLPPKVSVEIGGTFEIRCTVAGVDSDAVQYTWIKHSHEPSSDLPPHIQAIGSTLRGQNIQPSDYAYYMCKAEVPLTGETVVAYTLLDVQRRKIAPSALIFPSDLIDVYEGESVSFTCYPQEGDPHPDISWSRIDGKAILPPSRIIDSQLELIQVSKETATQYQCTMTNIAGSSSAIATVNIKAPPGIKIMTNPDHIGDIHNEHPVYVQCVASGTPTPDVYWTRNGHNVTMPEPGYSLLIINPSLLSNGIHSFECVAKNIYEIKRYSTSIRIYHERQLSAENDVIKSKSITASITAEPKSPKVGDDILLTCSIDRDTQWNRPVTYIWRKDGKHLSTNLNLERFDIHLIRKASHMDSGVYECDIEGNQFTYKAHFSLQISDLLSSTQRTSNKLSTVGSDVSLECPLASAHPTIEIEWSRYESVLPSQSHIFEDKLIIQDIQQEDSGIYICTIKQNRQIQQHFVNLTVNYAGLIGVQNYPISVQLSATPTEFSYGYKVTMFCYVAHNNINVRYSWLKDGRSRMRSGVALKDNRIELYVQQADLGIYTCDVTRQNDGGLIGSSSLEMYADPIRLGLVHIRSAQKPLKTVEKLQPIAKGDRPVLIKIRPLQGNYHINGQIGFECDSSARDADIFWERVSPTLLISLPARIEQNRIMFDRFSHDDVGQYVCNVKSDGKIHKKYLHLDIDLSNQDVLFSYPEHELVLSYGAPNINVTFLNPPSEFKRGGNIEVECIVSGQQDAPITWTREKKDMSSNTFIHKTILKFFNFVEHNLGEYRCSAKTSVGELSKIIVFEPESFPGISFNTSSYKSKIDFQFLSSRSDFRAGGHVVVECVVSDSLAHITWKKLRKSNSASMKVKDRFLIISPFTSSDLGTYECQAITNGEVIMRSLEFDEHNLYANLLPVNEDVLPNIELKMSEKNTYTVGGKIDITCTVKNDPTALISWHRGNRRHLGSATEIRDNLLRFHNVMSEDVGIYSCIATNNHGSQYISFEIKISDDNSVHILNEQETKIPITRTKTPLITEFLNPLSEFKRNGEISVLCYFANDVPGTVEWAKISDDQKRILPLQNTAEINGAKLRFLSFNAADLGLYQCTGYGEHGVSKRVVKLDDHTFSVIKRIPKIYSESESDKLQIIVEGQEIGQRVKLLCKMNTSRIAVKWEYEGGQIVDEFNTIMQIGTRLIFEKFQPKHHGVYTCKARYNGTRMIKHVDTRMHIHDNKDNILSSWLIF